MSPSGAGRMLGLPVPVWLVALGAVPIVGGVARLLQLFGGGAPTPDDLRFTEAPIPVTLHIVAATLYSLVGAFQFDSDLRLRASNLHRTLGRFAVICGTIVAVSGLWMALASPIPSGLQGELLRVARVAVGAGMTLSLVMGVVAIRAGKVRRHMTWMARAYGLAMGAGTQAILLLPPTLLLGEVTGLPRDITMMAAWSLNLWVVERAFSSVALPAVARAV